MSTIKSYDIIVIGAGIVGLTVALEVGRREPSARIAVLEKETETGRHASGRNSGVLHAGIYYGSETLKARVCASGSRAMQTYAAERGIPMKKTGKVIVATRLETVGQIAVLQNRAEASGIRVELLDEKTLREIEPHARSVGEALYSPDTAVIDAKSVLNELCSDLQSAGVDLLMGTQVKSIHSKDRVIDTNAGAYAYGHLINCAGAYADRIAHLVGSGLKYSILPFRGSYYRLAEGKKDWVRGSIYPAPDLRFPFLGVHLTRSISGDVYLGPTANPVFGRENYHGFAGISLMEFPMILGRLARMYYMDLDNFRTLVRSEVAKYSRRKFLKELQAMVPGLAEEDLVVCGKAGIRPQLVNRASWKLEMDFIVEEGYHSTHVLNAISPAFTAAFAFAGLVADKICGAGAP